MQIEKQTYRKNRHVDRKTDMQIEKLTYRQKNRHIDRKTDIQIEKQTYRQKNRHIDRTYR